MMGAEARAGVSTRNEPGRVRLAASVMTGSTGVALALILWWCGAPSFALCEFAFAGSISGILLAAQHRTRRTGCLVCGASLLVLTYYVVPAGDSIVHPRVFDLTLAGQPLPAPWLGRISERELIRFGSSLGLTERERKSVRGGARLEALIEPSPQRVLESWFVDRGRYRVLIPEGVGPFPMLVFLHGNGGLFSTYTAMLRSLADDGILVVLPEYGFGFWQNEAAHRRIDLVRDQVMQNYSVRADRVVLAGLSAGGMGALDRFLDDSEGYRACVSISGVPLGDVDVGSSRGARVIILHGEYDERVPASRVQTVADILSAAGVRVECEFLPADHLMMATHSEAVLTHLLSVLR